MRAGGGGRSPGRAPRPAGARGSVHRGIRRQLRGDRKAVRRPDAPRGGPHPYYPGTSRSSYRDSRRLWPGSRDDLPAGLPREGRRGAAPSRRRDPRLRRLGEEAVIGLVAATANGRRNAAHLERAWPDACLYEGKPKEALRQAWQECDGVVLFLATGAVVRLVVPLLGDKRRDPGVVCVDDAGRFAVALTGGHGGGANALAGRVADTLGAAPVVTTASDVADVRALDSLGAGLGFKIEDGSDLAAVGAALVSGERVNLVSDMRRPLGPLPENVIRVEKAEPPLILISDRIV